MNHDSILTNLRKYPNIRQIFSEKWVSDELKNRRERIHPILRLLEDNRHDTVKFMEIHEECLKEYTNVVSKDSMKTEKLQRIKDKLLDPNNYWTAISELEWIGLMSTVSSNSIVEPTFPNKGPDLSSVIEKRKMIFEIKSLTQSEFDRKKDNQITDIFKRIKKMKSNFHVSFNFKQDVDEREVFNIIKAMQKKLIAFTKDKVVEPVSVYYFSKTDIQDWVGHDGLDLPDDIYINMEKYPLFFREREAKAVVTFHPRKEFGETIVGCGYAVMGMNDDKRVRTYITKKLSQLSTKEPSVIVLDVSYCRARELDIANALYGTMVFRMWVNKETGETKNPHTDRERDGIFGKEKNSRISAVVMYLRSFSWGGLIYKRIVFPNPFAKYPLSDKEIRTLGTPVNELREEQMN